MFAVERAGHISLCMRTSSLMTSAFDCKNNRGRSDPIEPPVLREPSIPEGLPARWQTLDLHVIFPRSDVQDMTCTCESSKKLRPMCAAVPGKPSGMLGFQATAVGERLRQYMSKRPAGIQAGRSLMQQTRYAWGLTGSLTEK